MTFRSMMLARAALLPLLLLAGCDGGAKSDSKAAVQAVQPGSVQQTADGLVATLSSGPAKKLRLQVINDRTIRVTAVPTDSLDIPASLITVAGPAKDGFTVEQDGKVARVKTPALTAELNLATGAVRFLDKAGNPLLAEKDRGSIAPVKVLDRDYYTISQSFNPGTDEAFYGLGQHQNGVLNWNGEDLRLAQHNMDIAVPFVVSSRNYGLLWDNNSITRFGVPHDYADLDGSLTLFDAEGKEGALTATYAKDGETKLVRRESKIDWRDLDDLLNWPGEVGGNRRPDKTRDTPGQKVTWQGKIATTKAGTHKFQLYSSGYATVFVDGKEVIHRWRQNWNPWFHNFEVALEAGKQHDIRIEWQPDGGYIGVSHQDPLPDSERHALTLSSEVANALDYYVIAGDDIDGVIAGYRQLTGKSVMLPRWAYGFWQSRERYKTQEEVVGTVKEFRKRGIPLDNIVLDWNYWPEDSWGSHDFDKARFPDPAGMVGEIHKLNARFMISVWPKFYPNTAHYKELDAKGYIYRRNVEKGERDWIGDGYLNAHYDPYSQEARDIYWRQMRDKLNVLKVDAWWLDNTEPDVHSNLPIEEVKLRIGPTAMGPGAAFFNSYPLMQTKAVYEGERRDDGGQRSFILTRSGFAGQQRHGMAVWSGDVVSRFVDLEHQIAAGINTSLSGLPNWTTDIGGFALEKRFEAQPMKAEDQAEWRELNLRWFQFGAFSPLFRSHGQFPLREIYHIAPEGSDVYQSMVWYTKLRYSLLPYIYTLAGDTWHKDGTIMRALAQDFPADAKVKDLGTQYLFGPSILVAPVYIQGATTKAVYLPAGANWVNFYTGERLTGGQEVTVDAPLSRIPLFVREGSVIPTGPAVQSTAEKQDGSLLINVYAGADGSFDLYEDEGTTYGYEKGEFSRIKFSWNQASGELTIAQRQGTFPGMVAKRSIRVRWIDGKNDKAADFNVKGVREVVYEGQPLVVKR